MSIHPASQDGDPAVLLVAAELARRQDEITQLLQAGRLIEASRALVALMDAVFDQQRQLQQRADRVAWRSRDLFLGSDQARQPGTIAPSPQRDMS